MEAVTQNFHIKKARRPHRSAINICLYELIEAINEEVGQGEDWLVAKVVSDLSENKRIRLKGTGGGLAKEIENANSFSCPGGREYFRSESLIV